MRLRHALAALLASAPILGARAAHAVDAEVTASTAAQAYAVRSAWGDPLLERRRFTQTLGLGVYNLQGDYQPGGPQLFVKLRMRLDADFGVLDDELAYSGTSTRFVPGLSQAPVDLMYGYLEGKNLAHGWLGFRVGRQYVVDSLGWWSFDGGLVRVTTPFFVQAEVYGGYEQRGGLPLSTSRFEQNGMWRGDRTGYDPGYYPQFQKAALAPAYGAALETSGVQWVHARLDYRKVENRGDSVVSQYPDPATGTYQTTGGARTSSERIGYAMDANAMKLGAAKAGVVYDLYDGFFSSYYGGLDWYGPAGVTVGIDHDYFRPTFDADSIFNFFAHGPMRTTTGRVGWEVSRRLDVAVSGGVRFFYVEGDPSTYAAEQLANDQGTGPAPSTDPTKLTDLVGNASGRFRFPHGIAGVRGMWETGERGHREGADLWGERRFAGERWLVEGRTSLYDWRDGLRPDRSATSFAYVVGFGFKPADAARALVELEHDINAIVGQRYRVLALLDLSVTQ